VAPGCPRRRTVRAPAATMAGGRPSGTAGPNPEPSAGSPPTVLIAPANGTAGTDDRGYHDAFQETLASLRSWLPQA